MHLDMGATGAGRDAGGEQVVESGHQDVVHDVAMDFYGKRLASCSSDRLIKLFAVGSSDAPTALATLSGHEGPVWQVAWAHPKFGSILASCSYDRRVIIWREGAENEWSQAQVKEEEENPVMMHLAVLCGIRVRGECGFFNVDCDVQNSSYCL